MNVIKLGGSVVTDKDTYRKVNTNLLRRLCGVLSKNKESKILIHGAGSFGHLKALEFGLERPGKIRGREGAVSRVISDVLRLDSIVVGELNEHGIRAVSIPPHAIYRGERPDFRIVEILVGEGLVPVLFGDIIAGKGKYRIVSGDEIAFELARKFKPTSVVFATDVDGLFDRDPKKYKDAKFIPRIDSEKISIVDTANDATGSMAGKMERIKKMVRYTDRVVVLNGTKPERLDKFLRGEKTKLTVVT